MISELVASTQQSLYKDFDELSLIVAMLLVRYLRGKEHHYSEQAHIQGDYTPVVH